MDAVDHRGVQGDGQDAGGAVRHERFYCAVVALGVIVADGCDIQLIAPRAHQLQRVVGDADPLSVLYCYFRNPVLQGAG